MDNDVFAAASAAVREYELRSNSLNAQKASRKVEIEDWASQIAGYFNDANVKIGRVSVKGHHPSTVGGARTAYNGTGNPDDKLNIRFSAHGNSLASSSFSAGAARIPAIDVEIEIEKDSNHSFYAVLTDPEARYELPATKGESLSEFSKMVVARYVAKVQAATQALS